MPRKVLIATLLATAVAAAPAFAIYAKPSGTYKLSFFGEPGGKLKVKKLKLTKLAMKLTEEDSGFCDIPTTSTIGLAAKPKLKKFPSAGGRYAYGKIKAGLIVPKAVIFKIGGASVGGQLELLFDESADTLTTGKATIGDCNLQFSGNR